MELMSDNEIVQSIEKVLKGTTFVLVHFERNHEFFGNMDAKIRSGKKVYNFISDRDDIFCNDDLIFPHSYHVAGEDDLSVYFIEAISLFVRKNK